MAMRRSAWVAESESLDGLSASGALKKTSPASAAVIRAAAAITGASGKPAAVASSISAKPQHGKPLAQPVRGNRSGDSSPCRPCVGRSAGTHEPVEQLSELDRAGPGRDCRIVRGEGPQLVLALGLDDAESPGSGAVEHRAEDHHLTRLDKRLPVGRVTAHDLPLLVGHVEGESRARSVEPEHKSADALKSRLCTDLAKRPVATTAGSTSVPGWGCGGRSRTSRSRATGRRRDREHPSTGA